MLVRGRVCGGRVGQGPSWLGAEYVRGRDVWLGAEYVRGRDVQLPFKQLPQPLYIAIVSSLIARRWVRPQTL